MERFRMLFSFFSMQFEPGAAEMMLFEPRAGLHGSSAKGLRSPLEFQGCLWVTISFKLIQFFCMVADVVIETEDQGMRSRMSRYCACPGVRRGGNNALRSRGKMVLVTVYVQEVSEGL